MNSESEGEEKKDFQPTKIHVFEMKQYVLFSFAFTIE